MSYKLNIRHRREWDRHGLLKYRELLAQPVTRCNVGEDESGEFGEWYYVPAAPLPTGKWVIYYGYYGAHLPRTDAPHVFAQLFDANDPDDMVEFTFRVREWSSQPERDPHSPAVPVSSGPGLE